MISGIPEGRRILGNYLEYKNPIDKMTTRLSIRSMNKGIEIHSTETFKTPLTRNMIEILIKDIPIHERRKYSQHCLPVAVMYSNSYIFMELTKGGLRSANTWCLFQALIRGDEEMSKLVVENMGYNLQEEDIISFLVASYIGGKISLGEIFEKKEIKSLTRDDVNDSIFMHKLITRQKNLINWAKEKYCNRHTLRYDHIKTCDCPRFGIEDVANDMINLEIRASDSLSLLDQLIQYVRIYGMFKWGYIEFGGHLQIPNIC